MHSLEYTLYNAALMSLSSLSTATGLGDQGLLVPFVLLFMGILILMTYDAIKDGMVPLHWGVSALPVEKGPAYQEDITVPTGITLGWDVQEPAPVPMPTFEVQGKTLLDKYLQPLTATVVMVEAVASLADLLGDEEESIEFGYGSYGFSS